MDGKSDSRSAEERIISSPGEKDPIQLKCRDCRITIRDFIRENLLSRANSISTLFINSYCATSIHAKGFLPFYSTLPKTQRWRCSDAASRASLLFREVYKLYHRLRLPLRPFFKRPVLFQINPPTLACGSVPWLVFRDARKRGFVLWRWFWETRRKARGADSRCLACLLFVSGLFTPKWAAILWSKNGHASFSRNAKSSDVALSFVTSVLIDRDKKDYAR